GARVLAGGAVVPVACGAVAAGWPGDSAFSPVAGGATAPADLELVETTEAAMWAGIAALATGGRLSAVGEAGEEVVDLAVAAGKNRGERYGTVEEYGGRGIGSAIRQPPEVPNYRARDRGPRPRPWSGLAIGPAPPRG